MRVLVTGNLGYVGAVLTSALVRAGHRVTGYDTGYYAGLAPLGSTGVPGPHRQITNDVRDAERADFEGMDAVIHLAALSNDPLGALRPGITEHINYGGTVRVAEVARAAGVRRFVYASSQSMYGVADISREVEEDASEKHPVTAYARTKWEAEQALASMVSDRFEPVFLRPSTVFGPSPRLRCDIVFNNLVASGYTTGTITVLSDGTPWRPVVHVEDVTDTFLAALAAPAGIVAGEAFNVGIHDGNYTVRDLAEAARASVPGCGLEIVGRPSGDERTYRVSFAKLHARLRDYVVPSRTLAEGGRGLVGLFRTTGFTEADFRGPRCTRLSALASLLSAGQLDDELRWTSHR